MDKVKILHSADLHFDTPFKEFRGVLAEKSKEELREVFSRIIDICIAQRIEILLLAGDIFDNLTVSKETLKFIGEELRRIKNVKVFISPGNHDPYNYKSFYNLVNWPENVHIFKGNIEAVSIPELKTTVWGAGFNDKYIKDGILNKGYSKNGHINIMVIHGELTQGSSEYNPITKENIAQSGMDYIALGHTHSYTGINKSGMTYYAYPGCPQGRGFDELGDKGVIVGDIFKGGHDLSFKAICKRRYREVKVNISNSSTYEDVKRAILNTVPEEQKEKDYFKIILTGELSEEFSINEERITEAIKDKFYFLKVVDKTTIKLNLDSLKEQYSLKGIYASKIFDKMKVASEEEKELLTLALKLGLQSLNREEVTIDDY